MPQSSKLLLATVDFWKSVPWPGNHACLMPDRNAVWVTAAAFREPGAADGCGRGLCPFPRFLCALVVAAAPARLVAALLWNKAGHCAAAGGSDRRNRACALLSLIPSNSRALPPLRKAGISRSARF